MSKRFRGFWAALALALGLHAPSAVAGLIVSATQASGAPGENVSVTLNIVGGGSAIPDLTMISAYTFNFDWGLAPLDFVSLSPTYTPSSSSTPVSSWPTSSTVDSGLGYAVANWLDLTSIDFGDALSINLNLLIQSGAAPGDYLIDFLGVVGDSILVDYDLNEFPFNNVTQGNGPMKVTVNPMPEPGALSMLLAGLGIMAFVRRRVSKGQA